MTPDAAGAALIAAATGWLALPFVPAVLEWRRKTDAAPLAIEQRHDGNVRHFSRGFRSYLQTQMLDVPAGQMRNGIVEGTLPDGTPFSLLTRQDPPEEMLKMLRGRVVMAYGALTLPPDAHFHRELYAAETLQGGAANVFRAICADMDVILERDSTVLRWLHTEKSLRAGSGTRLYGRVSAEEEIMLAPGCCYQRLHAPRIAFGRAAEGASAPAGGGVLQSLALEDVAEYAHHRWVVRGNLAIPPRTLVNGSLIVRGSITVGEGARVAGNVKCDRDVTVEAGARMEGSVVSGRRIRLGEDCQVHGPIIADDSVEAGARTWLGTPDRPTTVSADFIQMTAGASAFGTVWAREAGVVALAS